MLGGIYTPITPGTAGIGVAVQNSGQLKINTNLAGAGSSILSNLAYTSAFSVTAASLAESVVAKSNMSGNNSLASTSAHNAPAHKVALFAEKSAISQFEISANSYQTKTSGENSAAFLTSLRGNDDARNTMVFSGYDTTVLTEGNGAFAILSLASAGLGGASQILNFSGKKSTIRTTGDGAYAIHAASSASGDAKNTLIVSGRNSNFSTLGQASTALLFWSTSESKASNEITISGDHTRVDTFGENSHALTSIANGETGTSNKLLLRGRNVSISTRANSSIGYLSLVSDETQADSNIYMSGYGGGIITHGMNSHGIVSMTAGNSASSGLSMAGTGSRIATFGDNATGASLISLGNNYGSSFLSMSGRNTAIETDGDYATGAYLGSSGGVAAVNFAEMTGYNSKVVTRGDYSSGITFAGPASGLRVTGINAGIFTTGFGSHGVLFDAVLSNVEIGDTSTIEASGIDSDGLHVKQLQAISTIKNDGRVVGQRHGISSNGSITTINNGSILGNTGAGITFDSGYIFNAGRIKGPSAIVAQQLLGGAVIIDTPGEISSASGAVGKAIELRGNGNDKLIIGPFSTIIGTMNMGAGDDTLKARKGTNADLRVATKFEAIETPNGHSLLTLLEGGRRILIADPSLHLNTTHLVSDQVSTLSKYREPNFHNRWANGAPPACLPTLGLEFGSAHTSTGISKVESSIHAMMLNFATDECRDARMAFNFGYSTGSADSGSTTTEDLNIFGFGSAVSFDLTENTSTKLYSNAGIVNGKIRRRIMNNTLNTGFESGRGALSGWFINSGGLIATNLVRSDYTFTPYAAAELGFASTSRFTEMDTVFGLDIYDHSSFKYRVAAGVEVSRNPIRFNENLFAQISGSLSASFSDKIGDSSVTAFLGTAQHELIGYGPSSELSIDVGAKLSLWMLNRNGKAELQFLHQRTNSDSVATSVNGSVVLVF